jgi:hypothetical protein
MREQRVVFCELAVPSPFALPLMVERFREKLSTEKLKDRLDRMLKEMEKEAERPDADDRASDVRRRRSPFSIVAGTRILGDTMRRPVPPSTGSRAEASSPGALRRRTVLAAGAALSLPFGARARRPSRTSRSR